MDAKRPSSRFADLSGLVVLIVDDDDDMLELLRTILESRGARAVAAHCSKDALEALNQTCPDVIISDLEMPEGDGFGFIECVRTGEEKVRFVPAIALTSLTAEQYRKRAARAGFWRYLTKPVDATQLCSEVARLGRASRDMKPPSST